MSDKAPTAEQREIVSRIESFYGLTSFERNEWFEMLAEHDARLIADARKEGIESVDRIRCMEHREVPRYNHSEVTGIGECAACAVRKAERDMRERCAVKFDTVKMEYLTGAQIAKRIRALPLSNQLGEAKRGERGT